MHTVFQIISILNPTNSHITALARLLLVFDVEKKNGFWYENRAYFLLFP